MTGDILRRLRKAYGFPADVVAGLSGVSVAGLKTIERDGTSYARDAGNLARKQRNFRRVLGALRRLKKRGGR